MPFRIIRNDITLMETDAIVNTANPKPRIGGGTDYAIYHAAGEDLLLAERKKIGVIERGQAAITPAFGLKAKYIIHTVGPKWIDGSQGEEELLRSCYRNSLRLASEKGCESISFPMISTGIYGFPKDLALQITLSEFTKFLSDEKNEEMDIYLVVFDSASTRLSEKLFSRVESKIDSAYVEKKKEFEYRYDQQAPLAGWQSSESDASVAVTPSGRRGHMPDSFSSRRREWESERERRRREEEYERERRLREEEYERERRRREDEYERERRRREETFLYDGDEHEQVLTEDDDYECEPSTAESSREDDLWSVFSKYGYSKAEASPKPSPKKAASPKSSYPDSAPLPVPKKLKKKPTSLSDLMNRKPETFQQMLLRLMEERGMTPPQLYTGANISKKVFSKLKANVDYQPSKKTAFAFAISLRLNLDETTDLIGRAGYAFSPVAAVDVVIRYCIEEGLYDILEVETLLFELGLDTLTNF